MSATVTVSPPRVEAVVVGDSGWTNSFFDHLDESGLGHPDIARLGYRIPDGDAQLDPLPWPNHDTIAVTFNADVSVSAEGSGIWGVNVPHYAVAPDDFAYDPVTFTATWTLAEPLEADKLLLVLPDTVTNTEEIALDGEWEDGVSTVSGTARPAEISSSGSTCFRAMRPIVGTWWRVMSACWRPRSARSPAVPPVGTDQPLAAVPMPPVSVADGRSIAPSLQDKVHGHMAERAFLTIGDDASLEQDNIEMPGLLDGHRGHALGRMAASIPSTDASERNRRESESAVDRYFEDLDDADEAPLVEGGLLNELVSKNGS